MSGVKQYLRSEETSVKDMTVKVLHISICYRYKEEEVFTLNKLTESNVDICEFCSKNCNTYML